MYAQVKVCATSPKTSDVYIRVRIFKWDVKQHKTKWLIDISVLSLNLG